MENYNLSDFKPFSGFLSVNDFTTSVNFHVRINSSSNIELDFEKIILTKETRFIERQIDENNMSHKTGIQNNFSLSGKSNSGIEINIENIGLDYQTLDNFETLSLRITRYSRARLTIQQTESKPYLKILLKGFESSSSLCCECELGAVFMCGSDSIENPDSIVGYIGIQAQNNPNDLLQWHEEADKLLNHIRWIMSFASSVSFKVPIIEYFDGSQLEVRFLTKGLRQLSLSSMPVISKSSHDAIFKTAVDSFFKLPKEKQNIYIAIDWFITNPEYLEGRLIAAMTVLESLLASNLDEKDEKIVPKQEFKKYRETLEQVIKQCVEKWSSDSDKQQQDNIVSDINRKLPDLNRRSLRRKLYIFFKNWSVNINDIDDKKIKDAIDARDLIIHEGHYRRDNLLEHIAVIRELAIRFLFTEIGYEGEYISRLRVYQSLKRIS